VQTGDPEEFIGQMRINTLRADGSERTVELTPVQITLGGQAVFTGFLRDLTEIERSHDALADQTDPAVALRLAASERWDLVLTDLEVTGMSGLGLIDALRRVAPAVPVAVVTAHADGAALVSRADGCLTKPVRIDQLIATASALIGRARRTSQ
jgi:DNA-binding response OmpR family regulator